MREIADKIKRLGFDDYGVCKYKGETYLLVFMKYGYYEETDDKNFSVSPYYFASNKCYFASKDLCAYIETLGYKALLDNKSVYDPVLEACGAIRGDNNLFFTEKCGSLFCVHMIITNAPLSLRNVGARLCIHCGKCVSACPMSALKKDMSLCLRHRMDMVGDELCRDKITSLLGCDVCQRVCPINDTQRVNASYPEFNKEKIIRGDMSGIGELTGKNMARKTRLQFQGMCIAANTADTRLLKAVEESRVNDNLVDGKNWCIQRLTFAKEKQKMLQIDEKNVDLNYRK